MARSDLNTSASFSAEYLSATASDPAEYELAVQPWELLCLPQRAGDFRFSLTGIRTETFLLYREHYELPVKLQGLAPEGFLGIAVPLDYEREIVYWGKECPHTGLGAALPGPADAFLSAGTSQFVFMMDIDHLREMLPHRALERLELAARSHVLSPPPELVIPFSRWCHKVLGSQQYDPKTPGHRMPVNGMSEELVDFLLRLSSCFPPCRPLPKLVLRQRALNQCLEYLRERVNQRVSLADLCRISGASERTLQYAFRDEFGISPTEFMRRRRLGEARRDLVTSSARDTSVSEVALKYGFVELGRFAVEYRRLFGMRPSDSLRS